MNFLVYLIYTLVLFKLSIYEASECLSCTTIEQVRDPTE